MKSTLLIFLLTVIANSVASQISITLDGTINQLEWSDTLQLKPVFQNETVLITNDARYYYIGIRTDVNAPVSVFLQREDSLYLLHASASIGTGYYRLSPSGPGKLLKGFSREPASWCFRDPHLHRQAGTSGTFDTERELLSCLKTMGWASNTIWMGSARETEFVVSKNLLKESTPFCVIYYAAANPQGAWTVKLFPSEAAITGDRSEDLKLHQGDTQEGVLFRISGWYQIKKEN